MLLLIFITCWVTLSMLFGLIGLFRGKYFLEAMLVSLFASPIVGFIYVMKFDFNTEDDLLNAPKKFIDKF